SRGLLMWGEGNRVAEYLNPHELHCHELLQVYEDLRTDLQRVQIVELGIYGKALLLDGRIQSTEHDEYVYHEALLYPAYTIYNDLPDAFETNATALLFTTEYYESLRAHLQEGGLMVTHAGPANHRNGSFFASVTATLRSVFEHVTLYAIGVPLLGTAWAFAV